MSGSIDALAAGIPPLDQEAMAAARARQDRLTKPQGSLGRLESLAIQIAGITRQPRPRMRHKVVAVMAGDHGVAAEGVSAFPQAVTRQMVGNFLQGGAAINMLARQAGARVVIVDMGVAGGMEPHPRLLNRSLGGGTGNIAAWPAMSARQAEQAVMAGAEVVEAEIARGLTCWPPATWASATPRLRRRPSRLAPPAGRTWPARPRCCRCRRPGCD